LNLDDVISRVVKEIRHQTGIPVDVASFSLEQTPDALRVLYLGEEIALLQNADDMPSFYREGEGQTPDFEGYLEDSIMDSLDRIKKLSIDARMAVMNRRLDELSGMVLEELRTRDIDPEILEDVFFHIEDMGYPPMHYETGEEARGYPDMALTVSWDIVKVSHVLDYDTEPPMDAAAMAAEFLQEVLDSQ